MVNGEVWQRLLPLESRDGTERLFNRVHGRSLSARRSREINAASRQAREYFRNAASADYSVRPLLVYYGVASLTRALLLLLQPHGGEEALSKGHGLETMDWGSALSGSLSEGSVSLARLEVRTCRGLFSELVEGTQNAVTLHANSTKVDWALAYPVPERGHIMSLGDVFSRTPDLRTEYEDLAWEVRCAAVNDVKYNPEEGFSAKAQALSFESFRSSYEGEGYHVDCRDSRCTLSCSAETFEDNTALFANAHFDRSFGVIPRLYIVEPFSGGARFSQAATTFVASYFLGMLVRYFPTQWMGLVLGEKGDAMWPAVNRALSVIEESYPELVVKMLAAAVGRRTSEGSRCTLGGE